jgi:hypothetical protein
VPDRLLDDIQDRTFARATKATLRAYPERRRLMGAQLTGYLDRRSIGVISSVRHDGRPHSALGTFFRRGATFWLPTFANTVRERNVSAVPWIVLVVAEGDGSEHIAVFVEGPGSVIPATIAPGDVTAAFAKDWAGIWLRLDAERLLSYADEGMTGESRRDSARR